MGLPQSHANISKATPPMCAVFTADFALFARMEQGMDISARCMSRAGRPVAYPAPLGQEPSPGRSGASP